MTKKEKDGLKDLISGLNASNEQGGICYLCSFGLLKRSGDYFVSLKFNSLIYSPDFAEIMSYCVKHDILCSVNHYRDYSVLFFF